MFELDISNCALLAMPFRKSKSKEDLSYASQVFLFNHCVGRALNAFCLHDCLTKCWLSEVSTKSERCTQILRQVLFLFG